MTSKLYLIGTVHLDFRGPQRLERLLTMIKPDAIAVEIDVPRINDLLRRDEDFQNPEKLDAWVKAQQQIYPTARRELLIRFARTTGYEYRTSLSYCGSHQLEDPKPLDEINEETIERLRNKLFGNPLLGELLASDETVVNAFSDLMYLCNLPSLPQEDLQLFGEDTPVARDLRVEPKIRELCRSGKRVAYVGGLAHFFCDREFYGGPNLFDRLSDLEPKRIKLIDVDGLQK